jgi:hypothetical protein
MFDMKALRADLPARMSALLHRRVSALVPLMLPRFGGAIHANDYDNDAHPAVLLLWPPAGHGAIGLCTCLFPVS